MIFSIVFLALLAGPQAGHVSDVLYIRKLSAHIERILKNPSKVRARRLLEKTLRQHLDLDKFKQKVLVDVNDRFSVKDREEFDELFDKMISDRIVQTIMNNNDKDFCDSVEIIKAKSVGVVSVLCQRRNKEHTLKFFIGRSHGHARLVNMELSGALLSRNYRGSINKITRRDGVAGLLALIRKRINTPQGKSRSLL